MSKTFTDAVLAAQLVSKRAEKQEALSGVTCVAELQLFYNALEAFRVFNVKKFDRPTLYAVDDSSLTEFLYLLDRLVDRSLSGNAAKTEVTRVLGLYTERTSTTLERVLLKDLKCGATASTVSKVYPELNLSNFEVMLAAKIDEKSDKVREHDVELTEAILKAKYKLTFPVIAEAKYDGNRAMAFVKNGKVKYLSRSGLPLVQADSGIFNAEILSKVPEFGDFVLDGEVLGSSYAETSKARGANNVEARSNLKFYAFDIIPMNSWNTRNYAKPQVERSIDVEKFCAGLTTVVKSKAKTCATITELKEFYAEILAEGKNADDTLNGLGEGLIIKHGGGVYEWDRSSFWFKWKPIIDVDLKVTGFLNGEAGTKNEDKLGALVLEGYDENGRHIITNCGGFKVNDKRMSGLLAEIATKTGVDLNSKVPVNKDQMFRKYVWGHQAEFLGKTFMFEGQELSMASGHQAWAVRFPQLVAPRPDKD